MEMLNEPSYKEQTNQPICCYRLQPKLADERLASLDSTHTEIIKDLASFAEQMIGDDQPKLKEIIKEFKMVRSYADPKDKILKPGVHLTSSHPRSNDDEE